MLWTKNKLLSLFLLQAFSFALSYDVFISSDYTKAEINDRAVTLKIQHTCSEGEGYDGVARVLCENKSASKNIGSSKDLDREAVFPDIAKCFNLEAKNYTFKGEVLLTDLNTATTIEAGFTPEVKFCKWKKLSVENRCEDGRPIYVVSLSDIENYDLNENSPVFSTGTPNAKGSVKIYRDQHPQNQPIILNIRDDEWGANKTVSIPNNYKEDEEPIPGAPAIRLDGVDINLPIAAVTGSIGTTRLSLAIKSDKIDETVLCRKSAQLRTQENVPDTDFFYIDLTQQNTPTKNWKTISDEDGLCQIQYQGGYTILTNYPGSGYGIIGMHYTSRPATNNLGSFIPSQSHTKHFKYDILPTDNSGLRIIGHGTDGKTNKWDYTLSDNEWQLVTKDLIRESKVIQEIDATTRSTRYSL